MGIAHPTKLLAMTDGLLKGMENLMSNSYWSDHFKQVFCKEIITYIDFIVSRVMPTFDTIESEADAVAKREYERLGSSWSEDEDMGDCAEQAYEAGIDYYQSLDAVRQSLINITATALYHMFEQQVLLFHRKHVLNREEENAIRLLNMEEFKKRLVSSGIDIEKLSAWAKVDELKVVANVIKHAEGHAADKLRRLRPDLFTLTATEEDTFWNSRILRRDVYSPLTGEDIYITIDDLRAYSNALVSFWQEFANAIRPVKALDTW